jgi:hypothetical protein
VNLHRAIAAVPVGTYRLGAHDAPRLDGAFEGDCSGGLARMATLLGLSDGRRWTTQTLAKAVGQLRQGKPTEPGAVGFWNGGKHVMLWTGEEWWGYHGAEGTRAGLVGSAYWASEYGGWAPFPALDSVVPTAVRTLMGAPNAWSQVAAMGEHGKVAVHVWRAGVA